jgi:hypothetical protein
MSYVGNRPVDAVGVRSGSANPASGNIGELFYNTVSGTVLVWTGSAWVDVSGASIVPTGGTLPVSGTEGQLFYQSSDDKVYVWNGTAWVPLIGAESGATVPVSGETGSLFFETDTQTLYVWNGTAWDVVGGGSNVNSGSVTPDFGASVGALFFNTVSGALLVWDGAAWQAVSTVSGSLVATGIELPAVGTDGELFYDTVVDKLYVRADGAWVSIMPGEISTAGALPGSGEIGQLFFNTDDGNVYVWDGSAWVLVGGANGGSGVVVGTTLPGSGATGDLFFQTSDATLYVYDSANWVSLQDGSGVVTGSALPGSGSDGSLFYLTSNNQLYVRAGGAWVSLQETVVSSGISFPNSPSTGQFFFNTADGVTYVWNGTAWVPVSATTPVDNTFSVSSTPTTSLATIFTAPSTTGRRYILRSVQVTNISGNPETITGDIFFSSTSASISIANEIPVPAGSSLELLKRDKVLNPNDLLRLQSSNNGALSVSATYTTSTDTKYFGTGIDVTTTDITDVYIASGKSRVDSILVVNDSDAYGTTVKVFWTNSSNAVQAYFAYDFIIPPNSTLELLEKSKVISSGHKIRIQAEDANFVEISVSGKLA